jgi:hypothetical protein
MKGLGARRIHAKLSWVLGDDCHSPDAIERWLACFREGDLLCADHSRSGRPVIDISDCLRACLDKFPVTSANMMSKHFHIARGTIMEIRQRNHGLKSSPVDGYHMGHRKRERVRYEITDLDLKNVDEPSKSGGVLTTF